MKDNTFMIIEGERTNWIFKLNPFLSNPIINRVKTQATNKRRYLQYIYPTKNPYGENTENTYKPLWKDKLILKEWRKILPKRYFTRGYMK